MTNSELIVIFYFRYEIVQSNLTQFSKLLTDSFSSFEPHLIQGKFYLDKQVWKWKILMTSIM
jgi:hypothetical protein